MPEKSFRVVALVTDAFGGDGGIAQYNRDFLTALARCNRIADLTVLPRAGRDSTTKLPPRVRQLAPVSGRLAYSIAALQLMQRHGPIDVVFCGHIFMAPLAVLLARRFDAKLWVQVHGVDAWEELSWPYRRAVETADLVLSVSRYTRRRLLEWVGIGPTRVKVLPNTVEPRFQTGPKPKFLLERHTAHGKKVIMTVSRLAAVDRYKGHDRVIQVLPRVHADHPDAIYVIVGDGDDRPRLEAMALQAGLQDKVIFAGSVAAEELPAYYQLADVLAMPSTGEGFGIVYLEAIASGVHAIGGNKDGSVDPLADGALGSVVDPGNADELLSAISGALRKPFANADWAARFSVERFSGHVEAIVRSSVFGPV